LRAWPEELRALLRPVLPQGAFLRRDMRGLYVTDAPRRGAGEDAGAVEALGFRVECAGGLWRITPDRALWDAFEARCCAPRGDLSRSLARFRGIAPTREGLRLFGEGTRLLEASTPAERAAYAKAVRQRAAAALRTAPEGLFALGCIAEELEMER